MTSVEPACKFEQAIEEGDMVRALALALLIVVGGGAASGQSRAERVAEMRSLIEAQLVSCWTRTITLPAPPKEELEAVVSVRFQTDGRLADTPKIVTPKTWPEDPAARTYLFGILEALATCSEKGFQIPQSYFDLGAPAIELRFKPMLGPKLPRSAPA